MAVGFVITLDGPYPVYVPSDVPQVPSGPAIISYGIALRYYLLIVSRLLLVTSNSFRILACTDLSIGVYLLFSPLTRLVIPRSLPLSRIA